MIEDTEPILPPFLISQGVEMRWRAPRVEGSMETRIIDVSPLYVTHKVGDVSPLSWSFHSIPQLASCSQAGLIRIVPPCLANELTRLGGV